MFDLKSLVSWARRAGGDLRRQERDFLTADGTRVATLNNEGDLELISLEIDGVEATVGFALNQGLLIFDNEHIPPEGSELSVVYEYSTLTDDAVLELLVDSARIVQSDLALRDWVVQDDGAIECVTINEDIQKLIVFRAAVAIAESKSNTAADDAIKIRDGDTSIDTSTTGDHAAKRTKRLQEQYDSNLVVVRNRLFKGDYKTLAW